LYLKWASIFGSFAKPYCCLEANSAHEGDGPCGYCGLYWGAGCPYWGACCPYWGAC